MKYNNNKKNGYNIHKECMAYMPNTQTQLTVSYHWKFKFWKTAERVIRSNIGLSWYGPVWSRT